MSRTALPASNGQACRRAGVEVEAVFRDLRDIVNTIKHGPSSEQLVRIQNPIDSFSETHGTWADDLRS
jgi:hypothetical protein